jgi:hypothetical protein
MEVRKKTEDPGVSAPNAPISSRANHANHIPSFLSSSELVFPMPCTRYRRAIRLSPLKSWNH